jgi:plasmid stabilization system protein ParE
MAVRITANFERNLEGIRIFLSDGGSKDAFDSLVDALVTRVVPTLEDFPAVGADFLAKAPLSADGRALFERVARLAGTHAEVRQLVEGDYIVLYALRGQSVDLLSIRHHRQLSFDFFGHWP